MLPKNVTNVGRKERKNSKRQLFTPQNVHSNLSPITKDDTAKTTAQLIDDEYNALLNFEAPSWTMFRFDRAAILACFN